MKKVFTLFVLSILLFSTVTPSFAENLAPTEPTTIEISGVVDGVIYNTSVTPIITGSNYKATLDGWKTFVSGTVIDREGSHTLKVVSNDGSVIKEVKFQIDKTAPTFSTNLDYQPNTSSYKPSIYITNYDYSSVTLYYTINGASNSVTLGKNETYYFTEFSTDGTYTVSAYLQDQAGNQSKPVEKTFTIDTTGPDIYVLGVEEGGVYRSVTPTFSASEGTVTARLDYWDDLQSGTAVTEEGSHTLTIEASDESGNRTTKTVKFKIDATGPKLQDRSSGWYDYSYILNASAFSVTAPIELSFNEEVDSSSINSSTVILRNVDTGQIETLDFSSMTQQKQENDYYSYYGDNYLVSIPLKEKLKGSSNYKLTIITSAIKDRVGNSMNADNNVVVDIKTRPFYGAPELVKTNMDSDKVNGSEPIVLEFKEPLEKDKVDASRISFTNVNSGVQEQFMLNVDENTITITPNMGLAEDAEYKLYLEADSVNSLDNVPMETSISKQFQTAGLLRAVSGPETTINEKRPGLVVTFSNPIDESFVSDQYFTLMESGNSNRNEVIEVTLELSNDKKTITVVPQTALQSGETYTLTVSESVQDIYKHSLASKDNVSYTFDVGNIETNINPASSLSYKVINFKTIELSFTDFSQGEEGYYVEIDGDKQNMDYIPSVKGVYSTVTHQLVFEKPTGVHSIKVIPVVNEGEEDYDNVASLSNIKLATKKPVKPIEVRAKLLKDGTLEWSWKDVPSDYEGEASYIIIRKSLRAKVSSKNRTRSSNGKFIEILNLEDETIVNNTITRYISRSVNVDGTSGADFESDKVVVKIKLPAKPPTASLKKYEYEPNTNKFNITWNMKDSKNVARKYRYVLKRNKEIVATTDYYSIRSGISSYPDSIDYDSFHFDSYDYYYYSLNEDDKWQIVVETFNSVGDKTASSAKSLTFINE